MRHDDAADLGNALSVVMSSPVRLGLLMLVPLVMAQGLPGWPAQLTREELQQRQLIQMLQQRWQLACDELNRANQKVTLQEAVDIGLKNNPVLSTTFANWQATEWQAKAIRREWYPSLTADNPNPDAIAYRHLNRTITTTTGSTTTSTTSNQNIFYTAPRLQLNWTFLDPSRTPRLKASIATIRSRQLLFDVGARNLVLDIQTAYYQLQQLRELRLSYAAIYELTGQQIRIAIAKRRSGFGSQGDVDQLRSQLLQQLIQLIQLYEQETTAANQLAYVMSLKPGDLVLPADPLSPGAAWQLPLQDTIDQAVQLREEIKANLAQAESFGWSSVSQLNRYLPSVSIFGQSQYNSQSTSSTASGNGSGSSSINQFDFRNDIGLSFSWLLMDGGIDVARARSLQEQSLASQSDADQERYRVALQVENSYATYRASSMVVDTARLQVKQARKTVDFAIKAYNGTSTDATTFIQNIQNYLNAETSYSLSVRRYNTAVASLYRYSALWPEFAVNPLSNRLSALKAAKVR